MQVKKDSLYIDEPCVTSMFFGELGWFIQYWQGYLRNLKLTEHKDKKFVIMTNTQYHPIVADFVSYTIDLPQQFYNLNLETDCYEAPLKDSPSGSLTPPLVYADLIDYFRSYYNVDKAIELWPPRGCNESIRYSAQTYIKYASDLSEPIKPLICVCPRSRSRAKDRNVPEFIWYQLVDILKQKFTVVICGTPSGSSLGSYPPDPKVINLINYSGDDKLEKVMHYMYNAVCTISSQSGPTHLGLFTGVSSYIIGHEKQRHLYDENRFQAPASFRYVQDYRAIDVDTIVSDLEAFLTSLVSRKIITPTFDILRQPENAKLRPAFHNLIGKKDLVGVEIGVDHGENALHLLEELDIKTLYLVDPYRMYNNEIGQGCQMSEQQCKEIRKDAHIRLKSFKDKIVWVEDLAELNTTIKQIPDNLDFVYIDGNHRCDYVIRDIEAYYPKVKDGGLIAGHDYEFGAVRQAVKRYFTTQQINSACTSDGKTHDWWYIKPSSNLNCDTSKFDDMLKYSITQMEDLMR